MIPRGSQSGAPSLPKSPRCGRCGTSVEKGVEYCYACKPIMDARVSPRPHIVFVDRVAPASGTEEPNDGPA